MTSPSFPAVGSDGKIQDRHLPDRLSEQSLLSLIRSEAVSTGVESPGLDILAQKLAFGGAGNQNVAIVADSTMNDGNESIRLFSKKYGALLPTSIRRVYKNWVPANNAWTETVDAEGVVVPESDGILLNDDFSTVAADLMGTTPDVGTAWAGSSNWASDGTYATADAAGSLKNAVGSHDHTMTTTLSLITTSPASTRTLRVYASSGGTGSVWANVVMNTSGAITIQLFGAESGSTSAALATSISGASLGITANSDTPQTVTIETTIDIQNVSMKVTGPTGTVVTSTGVISELHYGNLGGEISLYALTDVTGLRVDSVIVATEPTPAQGNTFDVWNGAIAGAKWQTFDNTKLTEMFGEVDVDVLILSMGHNNKTQTGESFVTETQAWIAQWMTLHPETKGIIWVSQNPQFPPAASPIAHRDRQMAMRLASKELGLEYISGYEAFSVLPDGGVSYVQADGIHPTAPSGGAIDGDFGAVLVADEIMKSIRAKI